MVPDIGGQGERSLAAFSRSVGSPNTVAPWTPKADLSRDLLIVASFKAPPFSRGRSPRIRLVGPDGSDWAEVIVLLVNAVKTSRLKRCRRWPTYESGRSPS